MGNYRSSWTVYTFWSLYCIYQFLQRNILLQWSHNYGVWNYWQQKLLYCICYTIGIDWHMIFGLEQEGGSLIAPMALAHPLHSIDNRLRNRRRNLWVGWCVSSWWLLFPSRSSVLINVYIFLFKQHFDTRYLVFCNPSPPRMFLSLDRLLEYRIQPGAIGPLYVTSTYSTWIFCRGVSGFATDCPCDVWVCGLTTCLLHVGPPLGNWFLNTSWAVGLTCWIVSLHFCCILTYAIIIVLIHHIIFWLYLYFLNILYFFQVLLN